MANVCTFRMMITGNKDGIEKFYKALTQASPKNRITTT